VEGNGMYTFADGSTFNGSTMSGSRTQGKYSSKDGSIEYDGEWRGESRHGRGKFIVAGDMKYIGSWHEDKRQGRGKCEFVDGSRYDGEWLADRFHGQGEWTTPNGHKYIGQFVNGLKHGQGHSAFSDTNEEYRGEYANGLEHGRGKRLYADGSMYNGDWLKGVRSGKGAMVYENGDQYQGEWRNDKRHGYGFCIFADGTKFRGEWEDDDWCQSTADPVFCKVFGPGVVRAMAGEATMLGIEARDELKNKRLSGGDIFTVKLTLVVDADEEDHENENGTRADLVEYGTVTDNGDGTYVAHYTCTVAGEYICEVLIGADEHCGQSPYDIAVAPARASAKHCVLSGDGVKRALLGERAEFVVEARDEYDNAVVGELSDEMPLKVSVTDVNGHEITTTKGEGVVIEDSGDGRYVVSYTPNRAGFYRVVASSNNILIGASPYSLRVHDCNQDDGDNSANANDASGKIEGSIAPVPNDLVRDWEIIARADYTRDGDDFGWDSAEEEPETEEERVAREHPDVPVVTNYEDMYKIGRLQTRMKEKRAAEQATKLAEMKAKLEVLELAKAKAKEAKSAASSLTREP
jgi:hypothetical protein